MNASIIRPSAAALLMAASLVAIVANGQAPAPAPEIPGLPPAAGSLAPSVSPGGPRAGAPATELPLPAPAVADPSLPPVPVPAAPVAGEPALPYPDRVPPPPTPRALPGASRIELHATPAPGQPPHVVLESVPAEPRRTAIKVRPAPAVHGRSGASVAGGAGAMSPTPAPAPASRAGDIIRDTKLKVLQRHYEMALFQKLETEMAVINGPADQREALKAKAGALGEFCDRLEHDIQKLAATEDVIYVPAPGNAQNHFYHYSERVAEEAAPPPAGVPYGSGGSGAEARRR